MTELESGTPPALLTVPALPIRTFYGLKTCEVIVKVLEFNNKLTKRNSMCSGVTIKSFDALSNAAEDG